MINSEQILSLAGLLTNPNLGYLALDYLALIVAVGGNKKAYKLDDKAIKDKVIKVVRVY